MGKCVYCGKLSNNKEKATLHKFPRDETLCKQWTRIIGREGWVPQKSSFLCSDHFTEDSFARYDSRTKKILIPGKVPTIMKEKDDAEDILTSCIVEDVPEPLVEIEFADCSMMTPDRENIPVECSIMQSTNRKRIFLSTPIQSPLNDTHLEVTMHEKILHDHQYELCPRNSSKKINHLRKRLDSSNREVKILKQQVGRLKKKVDSLKNVVKGLQSNIQVI